MNLDAELEVWRRQWQSETTIPPDLHKTVERRSRWMKIGLAADILVTIVMGGGSIVWTLLEPHSDRVLLASATWFFLAAAWILVFIFNRGIWSPAALNTAAFLDLSVKRCRAALAAIRFMAILYLCEIAFCLGWVYRHSSERPEHVWKWLFFSSLRIDIVWIATVVFFGFLFWYGRKNRAELAYFLNLEKAEDGL